MIRKPYSDEQRQSDAYHEQYKDLKYTRVLTPPEEEFSDQSDDNANFMIRKKPRRRVQKPDKQPPQQTISSHNKRYRDVGYFKNQKPDNFVLPHLRSTTQNDEAPEIKLLSSQSSFEPNKTIRMGYVDKPFERDEQLRQREIAITKKLADHEERNKFRHSNATYLLGDIVSSIKEAKQRRRERYLPHSIQGILSQSRNTEANEHLKRVKGIADSYNRDWLQRQSTRN